MTKDATTPMTKFFEEVLNNPSIEINDTDSLDERYKQLEQQKMIAQKLHQYADEEAKKQLLLREVYAGGVTTDGMNPEQKRGISIISPDTNIAFFNPQTQKSEIVKAIQHDVTPPANPTTETEDNSHLTPSKP